MLAANKYKLTLTNSMVDGAVSECLGEKDDSFTVQNIALCVTDVQDHSQFHSGIADLNPN
jgi:hypothetical protein